MRTQQIRGQTCATKNMFASFHTQEVPSKGYSCQRSIHEQAAIMTCGRSGTCVQGPNFPSQRPSRNHHNNAHHHHHSARMPGPVGPRHTPPSTRFHPNLRWPRIISHHISTRIHHDTTTPPHGALTKTFPTRARSCKAPKGPHLTLLSSSRAVELCERGPMLHREPSDHASSPQLPHPDDHPETITASFSKDCQSPP